MVPPRTFEGYAFALDCPSYPVHALCSAFLPLLRVQHPGWHRRRWFVFMHCSAIRTIDDASQVLGLSTRLIPWARTNEKPAGPQVLLNHWCSLSWTIRCGCSVTYGALRSLPDFRPFPSRADILQEPASSGRIITSRTFASTGRAFYRH